MVQPQGYEWVFTPVERGGGCGEDWPISGTDAYCMWVATGTPVQTVQAIAGHARGDTTLEYAQAVDARRAQKDLKLRYG